jgi:hypothetical protein
MAFNPSPEVKSILIRTHDLMTALSIEPLSIAGILLSKGFISGEIMSKMLIVNYTSTEKAAILVEAVRNKITIMPTKFTEFLGILSERTSTQEIVESLYSTYQSELSLLSSVMYSDTDMIQCLIVISLQYLSYY